MSDSGRTLRTQEEIEEERRLGSPDYRYPELTVSSEGTGSWNAPEKRPHLCPVCVGRQSVPAGFYPQEVYPQEIARKQTPSTCRTCKGAGVIWG